MRALLAFLGSFAGSVGFQMLVQYGHLDGFKWAVPWVWAMFAAAWTGWLTSHERITKQWLRAFHEKAGQAIYILRFALCLIVFLSIGFFISSLMGGWPIL